MKLEVGMYIRTDKGFIAKIKEFKHHYTKTKRLVDNYSVKEVAENYLSLDGDQCRLIESIDYSIPPCYPSDEELDEIKSHIVKASYNIVDLIKSKDIILGRDGKIYQCWKIYKDYVFTYSKNKQGETITLVDYQIDKVLTKEQMEQIAYKVEE